ncbi:MAG: hypothetical protein ACRDDF_04875 [Aeromonas sp.]
MRKAKGILPSINKRPRLSNDLKSFSKINLDMSPNVYPKNKSKIDKGDYNHYIINSNRLLNPNQVYPLALGYIPEADIVIKRIRKPLGNYLRLSIKKSTNEKT